MCAAAAARSLQSCLTLCDPIDGSPPGSSVPGILQARTLEWGAIAFSNAWKWKVKVKLLSRLQLLATPWTVAHQAPPFMGLSRQRVLEWGAIAFSRIVLNSQKIKHSSQNIWLLKVGFTAHSTGITWDFVKNKNLGSPWEVQMTSMPSIVSEASY